MPSSSHATQLRDNPFLYEEHIRYISLLRRRGDLAQVRHAREKMSEAFPLTEGKGVGLCGLPLLCEVEGEENQGLGPHLRSVAP